MIPRTATYVDRELVYSNELTKVSTAADTDSFVLGVNGDFVTMTMAQLKSLLDSRYLQLSGGTVNGRVNLPQGAFVMSASPSGGTNGYVKLITLKISNEYVNCPIYFEIVQRGRDTIDRLAISFQNSSSSDPALRKFLKKGGIVAYVHKSAASTWDIYVQKEELYGNIGVARWVTNFPYMKSVAVTFKSEFVTSVPSEATAATEADYL